MRYYYYIVFSAGVTNAMGSTEIGIDNGLLTHIEQLQAIARKIERGKQLLPNSVTVTFYSLLRSEPLAR